MEDRIIKPLASTVRPSQLDEIVGQDHLIGQNGIITKMINQNNMRSIILYGSPSTGKTSIALVLAGIYHAKFFNASTDKKSDLQKIISTEPTPIYLVIDEIHRMKTDTQDYLLSYLENGSIIMIGLTTHNPYYKVNPAIRSRALLLKMKDITKTDLVTILKQASIKVNYSHKISDEVYSYLAIISGNEVRSALNFLDILMLENKDITIDIAKSVCFNPNLKLDKNDDHHYELLSGLQKSIRGSDVDAALYYASKLIIQGDLDSLVRRLLVIAYEDIGIANEQACTFTKNALDSALVVGLPEARIMIGDIIVVLALSPKSNLGHVALDKALADIEKNKNDYDLPIHLKNMKMYKYPHDYPHALVNQEYLPSEMKNTIYFEPNGLSKGEQNYKKIYESIKNFKSKH